MKKEIILKGEGIHQHVLYGDFTREKERLNINKICLLKHETPWGSHGEHFTLQIPKGLWRIGKQVEFNPITQNITQVWD